MTDNEIQGVFTYHPPTNEQIPKYQELRGAMLHVALLINRLCPESREKSLAITHLQAASMFGNAAIAIHPVGPEVSPPQDTQVPVQTDPQSALNIPSSSGESSPESA